MSGVPDMIMARRSRPKPKAKPVKCSGSKAVSPRRRVDRFEDGGIDHAAAGDLDPAVGGAEGAGFDVHLEARLGEGEEVRAEAELGVGAEELAEEEFERAFEVGDADAFGDVEAFHLVELREVRGVDLVAAIGGAGGDDADGRRALFHGADLDGAGVGAQEAAVGR